MGQQRVLRGLLPLGFLLVLTATAQAAGMLHPRDGSRPIEVKSHEVTVEVEGGLARTTLRQTFVNPHRRELEAVYAFPVPRGAALTNVAMEVNGVRLTGLLVERQRGRKIYDEIVSNRQDPALVEQIGPDTFRLSVFPVVPRKDTVVELTWIEQLPVNGGVCRYVYPLALALGNSKTKQEFSFNLTLVPDGDAPFVTSPVKDIKIASTDAGAISAAFTRPQASLDKDVVVNIASDVKEPKVSVLTYRKEEGDGWFQILVTTPKPSPQSRLPLDLVLVLDTSRSMRGEKIEQAKQSALSLINGLRAGDAMTVVAFSAASGPLSEKTLPATAENLDAARQFVRGLQANGGSDLANAIEFALDLPKPEKGERSIVLLTDGLPTMGNTDPKRMVELAGECAAIGVRIFAFGLGENANPVLLSAVARATNGRSAVCRSSEDLTSHVAGFLDRIASPAFSALKLEVPGALIRDVFPEQAPDGFLGETISFAGRYRVGGEFPVTVRAMVGGKEVVLTRNLEFRKEPGGSLSVGQLYGRKRLLRLEEDYWLKTGLSQEAYFAALDAGAYSTADDIITEMISVSLLYGVQCPFTSFLVLLPEDRHMVGEEHAEAIAQARARAAEKQDEEAKNAEPPPDEAPGLAPDAGGDEAKPPEAPKGDESGEAEADPSHGGSTPGSGDENPPPGGGSDEGDDGDDGGGSSGGGGNGGSYRGPSGDVTPGDRNPNDPQPREKPASGGDDASGGSDPGSEDINRKVPTAEGGPSIAGGPGAGPRRKRTAQRTLSYDHWLFWWAYNKDEILHQRWQDLDLARTGIVIPEALPALRAAAKNMKLAQNVRAGAIVSLGRAGDPADAPLLRDLLEVEAKRLGVPCGIALGLLGEKSDETRDLLFQVAKNRDLGTETRSAALIAVGLIGFDDEFTLLQLKATVGMPSASADLPISALLAIGLIGSSDAMPELLRWLEDGRIGRKALSDLETAWVVSALGRIGDPRSARPLRTLLGTKGRLTRRSAAIALGRVIPACEASEQAAGVEALCRFVKTKRDPSAINFAVISLGRIAATPNLSGKMRKSLAQFLLGWFRTKDGAVLYEPFGALALGLAAPQMTPDFRARTLDRLTGKLEEAKGDKVDLGAVAIALGLAGDDRPETVDLLCSLVEDQGLPPKLRGASATALGLLGAKAGANVVLHALREGGDTALEVEVAAAAALLGDRRATGALLSIFKDRRASSFALGSAALALGRLGDRTAIPVLIDLMQPEGANTARTNLARAQAAQAIGYLADSTGGGALTRLSFDLNYRAMVPALARILSWQ